MEDPFLVHARAMGPEPRRQFHVVPRCQRRERHEGEPIMVIPCDMRKGADLGELGPTERALRVPDQLSDVSMPRG